MKKSRKHDTEEQILDEIRERVIEESENLKAEKEKLTNENVNLEALEEMTDLPMSRIQEISDEVKAGHNNKKDKARERIGKKFGVIIFIAAIARSRNKMRLSSTCLKKALIPTSLARATTCFRSWSRCTT
jgi:hypothetical protein